MFIAKKHVTFFCMALILTVITVPLWGLSRAPEPVEVPGKVVVRFQDDVDEARVAEIVESVGGTIEKVLASTGVHIIILAEGVAVSDAVEKFSSYVEVRYAEAVKRAQLLEE